MSSAISFKEFSEDDYRQFVRTLSDDELVKAGKRLRMLCGDVVTPICERVRPAVEDLPGRVSAQTRQMILIVVASAEDPRR